VDCGGAKLLGCDWIHDCGNMTERNFVMSHDPSKGSPGDNDVFCVNSPLLILQLDPVCIMH